jgi:hypothetical protein
MTAILTTKNLTQRVPRSTARVRNCSSARSRFVAMNSIYSLQRPGKPYTYGPTNRTRTSVEVWGGEDVGHRLVRTHIPLISLHSWSAIFLYVYTGQVAFTTIGPQDVASSKGKGTHNNNSQDERTPSQDSRGRSVPPGVVVLESCSPKSVYCLVNEVRLTTVLDAAAINISLA